MLTEIRTPIEVDITYVNKHWYSYRPQNNAKHYVIGFFERQGQATIIVLPDNKPATIHDAILNQVNAGSILYSEEKILPESLIGLYDMHELKSSDGHAKGDIHVNNVKNMWRDLKRLIKTTHIQVSQKHLQGYCDQITWHINNRNLSVSEKFNKLLMLSAQPIRK